ncbi:unnamed protein product [Strongylus vulgaris]|uniref:Uncharacterized protein n=1 Tax=Strongylus vulgaris TaxID=40348 RepID=A0A3P7LJ27_STRVU|nr:unnamed protein product [Strongylus vulgaris]
MNHFRRFGITVLKCNKIALEPSFFLNVFSASRFAALCIPGHLKHNFPFSFEVFAQSFCEYVSAEKMADPLLCLRNSTIGIAIWNIIYSIIQMGVMGWQVKEVRDRQWEYEGRQLPATGG